MNRRRFLELSAAFGLSASLRGHAQAAATALPPQTLAPWTPGTLDIHHLAYGRGNSTFILGPDGTTLLIDAGTTEDALDVSCAQRPNAAQRPGQWIAAYILRQMQPAARSSLDYALITHIHPDHIGDVGPENPPAPRGGYRLTGISDVDARVPIATLIDRGFPNFDAPPPPSAPFASNYLAYVRARQSLGQTTQQIQVGSDRQIRLLRHANPYPSFAVRNLAANGQVWTGVGDHTRNCFPDLKTLPAAQQPTENMCSIALRLSYGKFDYFTGGDLTSDTEESGASWQDIETPAAQAAGPVEVAVADHHAYFDAVGPNFVRALRPQVFILPTWYVGHPSVQPLHRMLSTRLYAGGRDLFATCVMEPNRLVNNQWIGKLKSLEGHIIVRVAPGGDQFHVLVTENTDDSDRIKLITGPYRCS